jgi:hypothetical protein
MCDELQERINRLRLEWPDVATAQRVHTLTYPLQFTLSKLNHSQGLGFAVGHLVVDKKTLNMLMISGKALSEPCLMSIAWLCSLADRHRCTA